ncbi:Asp-tRNA(Asn)/Glu-tRNA(Gln) amidotransferase subunit GatC [Helicobacter pametensis]|uniref:Asp-tRNA(Asn)/Glu-tRNA(Gln) amidotransferase subunit GatC n=1 Tax=Helicobacter pametensis TaxID=95149 RepID=UPI000487A3BF|nr:Asp-tRNA(Asn)/Glu-tRNA(Gln) amidotransferase subunit GatC [Helicobacter pametensis]
MQIDNELLKRLQKLGMIEIAEDKEEELKNQLSEILSFVENLNTIQTDGIKIRADLKTPLRDDEVKDAQIREDVLSHAPQSRDGFFIVPKIIE